MHITQKSISIESIEFESNHPDVIVKGSISNGHMAYDSELIISHSDLNRLMNQLQKKNKSTQINDLFTAQPMYNEGYLYAADIDQCLNNSIFITDFIHENSAVQIRA